MPSTIVLAFGQKLFYISWHPLAFVFVVRGNADHGINWLKNATTGAAPPARPRRVSTGCPKKMYHIVILNILKTMHVMCMILASSERVFHGNLYALTNTFPVMKKLGMKQGKVIVQYYFKFGSNILTKRQFRNQSPANALGRGYFALEICFNLLTR